MFTKKKIAVIFGGKSSEKEVSLATGRYVYHLLDPEFFETIALYMDYQGFLWQIPEKLIIMNRTSDVESQLQKEGKRVRFEELPNLVDLVFIALLGKYGEDGVIQGILELINVPYTGSGILASAIGMNKKVHKEILKQNGFLVPKDILIKKKDWEKIQKDWNFLNLIEKKSGFPCVVKPICEGSSVGVSVPKNQKDFIKAVENAFFWDPEVLIEEYIKGQEFMCVVWGNENPEAMLPTEVEFTGDFHTYESKYMPGRAKYHTPIRAPQTVIQEIQSQSVAIYKLIGAKGYGRVDGFLVKKENQYQIYIGEPHTGTIMIPSSYVFQQAAKQKVQTKTQIGKKQVPLSPRLLISKIIEMAFEAHQNKKGYL